MASLHKTHTGYRRLRWVISYVTSFNPHKHLQGRVGGDYYLNYTNKEAGKLEIAQAEHIVSSREGISNLWHAPKLSH